MATSHGARKRKSKRVMCHGELKKQQPPDAGQTMSNICYACACFAFILLFCFA